MRTRCSRISVTKTSCAPDRRAKLGNHQADRPAAEDGNRIGEANLAQVDGMQRHAQRLKRRAGGETHAVGYLEGGVRRPDDELLQRALHAGRAAEAHRQAEVGVAFEAVFAMAARGGGVDGDAIAGAAHC